MTAELRALVRDTDLTVHFNMDRVIITRNLNIRGQNHLLVAQYNQQRRIIGRSKALTKILDGGGFFGNFIARTIRMPSERGLVMAELILFGKAAAAGK